MSRTRVLFVSDLSYPARGRRYGDEDVALLARLRATFDVALCHPLDAVALMDAFDVVLVRNSGPVLYHREAYETFRREAMARGTRVYNPVTGRGDMAGKRYLVDLTAAGFPVIPTIDRAADLGRLPVVERYVVKPTDGADSVGLRVVDRSSLGSLDLDGLLVQPLVGFVHEVSFYAVDGEIVYALYAPDPARRWELVPYEISAEDLEFARGFLAWNTLDRGIQRVDACRTTDGHLLLVELEDLNPYLSLSLVDDVTRERFCALLVAALERYAAR